MVQIMRMKIPMHNAEGLVRESKFRPQPTQDMAVTDKILTAVGGFFVVFGAIAVSAAPITPIRLNPAKQVTADRWHQEHYTRFRQQYNVDGPASERWDQNRF
jgi:hypothetical protein